jgi:hypothetical protein
VCRKALSSLPPEKRKKIEGMVQVVQHQPGKCEALTSNSSYHQKRKKKKKNEDGKGIYMV